MRLLLGSARLVTLTGVGGIGKTRLALETAASSAKAFPDGVWLVDLAPVREPAAVVGAVAAAIGLPDRGVRPVLEQLAGHLAGRQALLVLDNCEHLVDACAELTGGLLSTAAQLRVLATSRQTLGITGEHVFTVPPLPPQEAVELLQDRTTARRPEFQVTDANGAAVSRLCADLDGLPLAIELAASRLRTLSVEQVVDRLEDRFLLLTGGCRNARPRQRTLRALIDWSYDLCTPAERLLWKRLSVFAGSFSLDAVEGVCAGEGIGTHEVLDLLDRLVTQSLVEHAAGEGPPRYRLLETIRQYGWERLVESGEDQRSQRRHRDFFLALAERLHQDWFGPRQAQILARLRAEHGNLLAALEYRGGRQAPVMVPGTDGRPGLESGQAQHPASGSGDRQRALALGAALVYHWVAGGFLGEGRRQLERALGQAPEPTEVRARALVTAAYVAQLQYDLTVADRWIQEAEELAERLGQPAVGAQARGHRGVSALYRGRLDEALCDIEQAVAAHTARGDRFGEVTWRCALAIVQCLGGDPRAPQTGRQALAAAEAHGERWARAHLLMTLGRRAWALGEQAQAKELTLSALETLRGFGDTVGVAKMVEQLAWITASDGDHERAGRLLGAARSLRHDAGITVAAGDPRDEECHACCEAAVRDALGSTGYEQALADGAAIGGPTEGIAYALGTGTATEAAKPPAAGPLTRREQQVAALVARGMTNRRIAAELVLSPRTVDGHVDRILTKLGFSCRAQIAAWWTAHQVPTPNRPRRRHRNCRTAEAG